jgi:Flp pilus assembly protein TadB
MSAESEQPTTHDEMQAYRKRAAHWPWEGLVALAVVFAAMGIAVLVHGVTARHILRGIEIAAVVVGIILLFRWAVLYERTKSSQTHQ